MELHKTSYPIHSELDLSQLPLNHDATITAIEATPRLASRLRELGFLPGEILRVLRTGPALIVQIGQTRLALRRRDAATVRLAH